MVSTNQVSAILAYNNGLGGSITVYRPQQQNPSNANQTQIQPSMYPPVQTYYPYVMNNSYYQNIYPVQSYPAQQPITQTQQPIVQTQQPVRYSDIFELDDSKTKAENFNDWTDNVATNQSQTANRFQIKSDDTKSKKAYMKDLEKISEDYIKMYDTNNDGKITFDEFWAQELKNAKAKIEDFEDADKKALKKQLKTIFNHLNVTNAGDSKDVLTKKEIMNMFFVMDGTNASENADGYISQSEYVIASNFLADDSKDKDSNGNLYSVRLKQTYKTHFHKK